MTAPARARSRAASGWSLQHYVDRLPLVDQQVQGRTVSAHVQWSVLKVLVTKANPDGTIPARYQPRVDTIAGCCRLDERTVRLALRALEAAGHVATVRGGGRATSAYRVVVRRHLVAAPQAPSEGAGDPPTESVPAGPPGSTPTPATPSRDPRSAPPPDRPDGSGGPDDATGPPGCERHSRRELGCPACLEVRRAAWAAGCRRHRRRRAGCRHCDPTPTPPRFVPAPATSVGSGVPPPEWAELRRRLPRRLDPPAARCVPPAGELAPSEGADGCPLCGQVDGLADLVDAPERGGVCRRCAPLVDPPAAGDVELGGAG